MLTPYRPPRSPSPQPEPGGTQAGVAHPVAAKPGGGSPTMLTSYRPPKPPSPQPENDGAQAVVAHPAVAAKPGGIVLPKPTLPFQLLEVTIISAQDLSPAARTVPTYAVAWVHPAHKLSTRVDHVGRVNPTWNDKFVFRVDDEFLNSATSAVMIQIYGSCRYRSDPLVGTVRLVLSSLNPSAATRFVALQVRRPSGRPQGILNVGVALLDGYIRSMPLYSTVDASAFAYKDLMGGTPQPREDPAGGAERVVGGAANGEDMLRRSGSVVVRPWGDDRERGALETKLERWRTELPLANPRGVEQRRAVEDEDEIIDISDGGGRRRKGRRSWSSGALSCFCEIRRHRD